MKKFAFSLEPLLKVKGIQEKQKKTELAEIQKQLGELYTKKTDLNHRLDDNSIRYGSEMRSGMPLPRMAWHANYADYLQTQIKALLIRIGEAEQQKEIRQTELVSLMKEMSTIERLREEQYRAYLHELANEEEKVLGDLISYDMSIETTD